MYPQKLDFIVQVPIEFKESEFWLGSLANLKFQKLTEWIWSKLSPIKYLSSGLGYINPSLEVKNPILYYKFIPASRIAYKNNDFIDFISTGRIIFGREAEFQVMQVADFVAYILENTKTPKAIVKITNDKKKFDAWFKSWIECRKEFFESDKELLAQYNAIYLAIKEKYSEAFEILNKLPAYSLKSAEAELFNLVELAFFAGKYSYVKRYIEEEILPVNFFMKDFKVEKRVRLYNQFEYQLPVLLAPLVLGDSAFNKKFAIYLNDIGFFVPANFMLYAENILSTDVILSEQAEQDVAEYLETVPEGYEKELRWWFEYLKLLAELRLRNLENAQTQLEKLKKISATELEIQAAEFLFTSNSK